MSFGAPQLLWGLVLIPLGIAGYLGARRRHPRYAVVFTNVSLLATLVARRPSRIVPTALFVLALTTLMIGMARPEAVVALPREEATIVLTIDQSASMLAEDISPNRITAAKLAARDFVAALPPRFQVGVVAFNDVAEVLTQPTIDRVAVQRGIDSIQATGSTAIGDALTQSLRLDPEQRWRYRKGPEGNLDPGPPLEAIILLSDGKQTAGKVAPLAAAAEAEALGLPVFTIALAPPATEEVTPADSGVDVETLRKIAQSTGGRHFTAPTTEDLHTIYRTIGSRLGFVKDHQELTFAFAGAGLLLALVSAGLAANRWWRFP